MSSLNRKTTCTSFKLLYESKIHAFIPAKCAQQHEQSLREGKICFIKNFTVQKYKEDDKFRPVHEENQLILSSETIIKEVEGKLNTFPKDAFDFYEHSELKDIADKTLYLIGKYTSKYPLLLSYKYLIVALDFSENVLHLDLVGIIENRDSITLRELMTRQQRTQFQTKFKLTDGRSNYTLPFKIWSRTDFIIYILIIVSFIQVQYSRYILGYSSSIVSQATYATRGRACHCYFDRLQMWNVE